MMFPYIKTALKNLVNKPVTEAFPAGDPPKAAENYRGRLSYDPTKCINCGMCIRVWRTATRRSVLPLIWQAAPTAAPVRISAHRRLST